MLLKSSVIRELLQERDVSIAKISRGINVVSHELAKLSRVNARTEFWMRDFPQEVAAAVVVDCNLAQS
jgi:Trp operon repressor